MSAVDVSDAGDGPPPAKDAGEEGEGPTISDKVVVKGTAKTRHIASIPYCESMCCHSSRPATNAVARKCRRSHRCACVLFAVPVTGLPFEFVEFSPLIKKARANFEENYKTYYPDIEGPEELAELMAQLGMTGVDAASKRAQSGKKPADPTAPPQSGSGKKKDAAEKKIVIELNNRNKKKHITTVKGLELFDVDVPAAAKLFGKRFACGSSLKKGQAGQPDQIEIQGSCHLDLPAILVDKLKMSIDDIIVVLDGKKVKAADAPAPK